LVERELAREAGEHKITRRRSEAKRIICWREARTLINHDSNFLLLCYVPRRQKKSNTTPTPLSWHSSANELVQCCQWLTTVWMHAPCIS
jgi:hypothetical protein